MKTTILKISGVVLAIDVLIVFFMHLLMYFGDFDNAFTEKILGFFWKNWPPFHDPAITWIATLLYGESPIGDPKPIWYSPLYFTVGLLQTFVLSMVVCFFVFRLRDY